MSSFAATQQVSVAFAAVSRAAPPVAALVASGDSGTWTGSIDSTTPTRWPPIRTSLFLTRRAPLGTVTETR